MTVKNISEIHTTIQLDQHKPGQTESNNMDSNFDICFTRKNYGVLELTWRTADVYPYNSNGYKTIYNIPIVSEMIAYGDPTTRENFILVLNDCLFYGNLLNNYLYKNNQIRYHGTSVCGKQYDTHHNSCIECTNNPYITLQLDGTKTYFYSRTPNQEEPNYCVHTKTTHYQPL